MWQNNIKEASQSAGRTAEGEETNVPVTSPFLYTRLRMYTFAFAFITNKQFQAKTFKYSTKLSTKNGDASQALKYIISCLILLLFLLNKGQLR